VVPRAACDLKPGEHRTGGPKGACHAIGRSTCLQLTPGRPVSGVPDRIEGLTHTEDLTFDKKLQLEK